MARRVTKKDLLHRPGPVGIPTAVAATTKDQISDIWEVLHGVETLRCLRSPMSIPLLRSVQNLHKLRWSNWNLQEIWLFSEWMVCLLRLLLGC